jgi:hypothetical protein
MFGDEVFAASADVEDDDGLVDHHLRPNLAMEPRIISDDLASKLKLAGSSWAWTMVV